MPAPSTPPTDHSWRQSWPPVQLYLQQQGPPSGRARQQDAADVAPSPRNSTEAKLDNNPMSYFLAPPRPLLDYDDDDDDWLGTEDDGENDDDDFSSYHTDISDIDLDMDAGIEDAAHPQPIVRAVSPSSLAENKHHTGGSHLRLRHRTASLLRPPTPPRQSAKEGHGDGLCDDDDDGDDYVRFGMAVPIPMPHRPSSAPAHTSPHGSGLYSSQNSRTGNYAHAATAAGSAFPVPATTRHLPTGRRPVRRRSPRSWRVPSPAVFSIEEETEQDEEQQHMDREGEDLPVRKQVRFVLPYEGV